MPTNSNSHQLSLKNAEERENVVGYESAEQLPAIDTSQHRRAITDYFERREAKRPVVKSTVTERGQTIDWIPRESQRSDGKIASPSRTREIGLVADAARPEHLAVPELESQSAQRGPIGTVPILRKKLDDLRYTKSLSRYLSKSRRRRIFPSPQSELPSPEEDGTHRYAASGQSITCYGGEGQLNCFDPYTESSDDFSLIQIGLSRTITITIFGVTLSFLQTVEAGWQELQDLTGDWVPHLFTFYTTNGYSEEGDNKGGYNDDVDGWVQYDDTIFPGTTFVPYSD